MNAFVFIDFDTQAILPPSAKWSGYESQGKKQGTQRAGHYLNTRARVSCRGSLTSNIAARETDFHIQEVGNRRER